LRGRYSIVVVTHNLGHARRLADNVGIFSTVQGVETLIEHGPVEQLFETPQSMLMVDYVSGARS
jgi:ABC-type phosphate transport system ATPase subunit